MKRNTIKKIITLFGACALAFSIANADINLYGRGDPHTALQRYGKQI